MPRVFLDTNFLIYGYDTSQPAKRQRSRDLSAELFRADPSPVISTQVMQEFYNTLVKKMKIPRPDASVELRNLLLLQVVTLTSALIVAAADLHAAASLSFWDALIITAAQSAGCDEVWTEDLQDGQRFGKLKIINPFKIPAPG